MAPVFWQEHILSTVLQNKISNNHLKENFVQIPVNFLLTNNWLTG